MQIRWYWFWVIFRKTCTDDSLSRFLVEEMGPLFLVDPNLEVERARSMCWPLAHREQPRAQEKRNIQSRVDMNGGRERLRWLAGAVARIKTQQARQTVRRT